MTRIAINSVEEFEEAFGPIGLEVGPRTGRNRRTKDDKEWYVIRRFLKEAILAEVVQVPLSIRKGEPPEPDYIVEQQGRVALFEVTEASDESDQREMTQIELSDEEAVLLGHFGGRFRGGTSEPGHAWSSDIVEAIERKLKKAVFQGAGSSGHLVIYPNSNASFLLSSYKDECRAFSLFQNVIADRKDLMLAVHGNFVHVLGKEAVFLISSVRRNVAESDRMGRAQRAIGRPIRVLMLSANAAAPKQRMR